MACTRGALVAVALALLSTPALSGGVRVRQQLQVSAAVDLRCERLLSPLGVDSLTPLLSWVPVGGPGAPRGVRASGFEVTVLRGGALVWSSGVVVTDATATRPPLGILTFDALYAWTVTWFATTLDGAPPTAAPASRAASFHTGLGQSAWASAAWLTCATVGACDYLRSPVFALRGTPVRATLHLATAGWSEAWVNGVRVGGDVALEGSWTQWNVRLPTTAYDVLALLNVSGGGGSGGGGGGGGRNALGIVLGNGWWGHLGHRASAAALLSVTYTSGDSDAFATTAGSSGAAWRGAAGPILGDDIYNGETYDLRAEVPGWATPAHDVSAWDATAVPSGEPFLSTALRSWQAVQPVVARRGALLPAVSVSAPLPSQWVVAFGVNSAGWTQLRLPGGCPAGARVVLRHAENLTPAGAVDQGNLRTARATETLVCDGRAQEVVYEPRFTYHGFAYVGVEGWPPAPYPPPAPSMFAKVEAHNAVEWAAEAADADAPPPSSLAFGGASVLGDVLAMIHRGQLSNLMGGVPTDCPQRDERQGWMADASVSAESATAAFDMAAFYTAWLRTISDSQASAAAMGDCRKGSPLYPDCSGADTDTSPHVPGLFGNRPADPSWGAALDIVYDVLLRYAYDPAAAASLYPSVRAYVGYLQRVAANESGLVGFHYYGDWLQPNQVESTEPVSLQTSGFNYLRSLRAAFTAASVLGEAADAASFAAAADVGAAVYMQRWFNVTGSGCWGSGRQNEQVYPLFLGLQPGGDAALETFVARCLLPAIAANGSHVDTGIISTKYLMPLLSRAGRSDVALELALQEDFPSWGAMARVFNETAIAEHWNPVQNPSGNGMSSRNHPALGSVGSWLYQALLGVRLGDTATADFSVPGLPPGAAAPPVGGDLGWARALVAPEAVRNPALPSARGGVRGARGTVGAAWAFDAASGTLAINASFPAAVRGQVRTPSDAAWPPGSVLVTEVGACGGAPVWQSGAFVAGCEGVAAGAVCGRRGDRVCLDTSSGSYAFVVSAAAL